MFLQMFFKDLVPGSEIIFEGQKQFYRIILTMEVGQDHRYVDHAVFRDGEQFSILDSIFVYFDV